MKRIEVTPGKFETFPDDATETEIEEILNSNYPLEQKEYKKPSFDDVFKEALKQRNPSNEYSGEVQKALGTPEGMALSLPLYFIPGAGEALGGAGAAANAGRLANILRNSLRIGGNVGQQAGVAASLSEKPEEAALESTPFSVGQELLTSTSPAMKLLKRGALMGLGGWGGYEVGKKMDHPWAGAGAGALLPGALWRGLKPAQKIEQGAIKKGLESMFPLNKSDEVSNLYTNSFFHVSPTTGEKLEKYIPSENLAKLKDNDIYTAAKKELLSSAKPEFKQYYKDIPEESVEFQDGIKKVVGDWIQEREGRFSKKLLKDYQKDLIGEIANVSPEYKEATALAERQITRRAIEDELYKKGHTGENFAKFLSNPHEYDEFIKHFKNAPEAQAQIEVMKKAFDRFKDIKPPEQWSRAKVWEDLWKTYKYDDAMKELASNPVWKGKLDDLLKISDKQKFFNKFSELVSKSGTAYNASSKK